MPVPQEKMFFVERAGEPVLVIFAILSNKSSMTEVRTIEPVRTSVLFRLINQAGLKSERSNLIYGTTFAPQNIMYPDLYF